MEEDKIKKKLKLYIDNNKKIVVRKMDRQMDSVIQRQEGGVLLKREK